MAFSALQKSQSSRLHHCHNWLHTLKPHCQKHIHQDLPRQEALRGTAIALCDFTFFFFSIANTILQTSLVLSKYLTQFTKPHTQPAKYHIYPAKWSTATKLHIALSKSNFCVKWQMFWGCTMKAHVVPGPYYNLPVSLMVFENNWTFYTMSCIDY